MKVTLRFSPYMRGPDLEAEIDAVVRGDLAIHRYATVTPEGVLDIGKSWTVSHVPTKDKLSSALPRRLRDYRVTRRELIAWAEAIQAACPAFFEAARDPEAYRAAMLKEQRTGNNGPLSALARDVINKGYSL